MQCTSELLRVTFGYLLRHLCMLSVYCENASATVLPDTSGSPTAASALALLFLLCGALTCVQPRHVRVILAMDAVVTVIDVSISLLEIC